MLRHLILCIEIEKMENTQTKTSVFESRAIILDGETNKCEISSIFFSFFERKISIFDDFATFNSTHPTFITCSPYLYHCLT